MPGHCETFEHTADVGLRAEGDSFAEFLAAIAEGLADFICPLAQVHPHQTRSLDVEAEDAEALTVDFLSAVLNALQADRFAIAAVRVRRADPHNVRADLLGEDLNLDRHEVLQEVKAVTYHQLHVAPRPDGTWAGQVILDL